MRRVITITALIATCATVTAHAAGALNANFSLRVVRGSEHTTYHVHSRVTQPHRWLLVSFRSHGGLPSFTYRAPGSCGYSVRLRAKDHYSATTLTSALRLSALVPKPDQAYFGSVGHGPRRPGASASWQAWRIKGSATIGGAWTIHLGDPLPANANTAEREYLDWRATATPSNPSCHTGARRVMANSMFDLLSSIHVRLGRRTA